MLKKKIVKTIVILLLLSNIMLLPICAANKTSMCMEPRWNNMAVASLTMGFDSNNVGYFSFSLNPYQHCTGFSGAMKLYDAAGNMLKSWAITDQEDPYLQERTYQCQYGETYTVTFDGYAYGTNSMYDEIHMSVTDTCLGR